MPWEYLDNLDYRYELVAGSLDFNGKDVVELCSGNTRLYDLVKDRIKSYRACDVRKLHPIVEQTTDDEFVKTIDKCDILCVFGHGGYEITLENLESKTLTDSIRHLMERFRPTVVLEAVSKFEPILENLSKDKEVEKTKTVGADWLTDRVLYIFRS